ncbi:sensor histidine kinase [Microbulbifer sp. 2205BS26-8]|uniref:sensor histidine kinase n=1 Tax=Microbulbifer sp. 2205BS26-8 TaxID=3064386 RepID=UPI00273E47D4|nr:histidine kinase [Microbulbifer sp. 2205BS26-8]MDP5209304.1 histidine kinase [Microbulbifer sp. 2205BS26-8]
MQYPTRQKKSLNTDIQTTCWFWKLQLVSWVGILLVTFLSLSLWHSPSEWPKFEPINTLFQCTIAFVLSLFLKPIFDIAWDSELAVRTVIYLLAVAVISGIWTLVRMEAYIRLSGEHSIWSEFGGWYYASLFVFLFWSALYCGVKYHLLLQDEHNKMLEVAAVNEREQLRRLQAEAIASEAQLKMLRYQLNPHFLFNTLNSINALIRFEQADEARQMVVRLSDFLRLSLKEDPMQKVTLEREIEAVLLYLEIEKSRFADRLIVDLSIDEQVRNAQVPSMLLQPLVENSVKYAIAPNELGGTIAISARHAGARLVLEVTDTGCSSRFSDEQDCHFPSTGVGVKNVRERLCNLYPQNFRIEQCKKSDSGMLVRIDIPLEITAHPTHLTQGEIL